MEILYEDKELIVCRKPAGIPVQCAGIRQKDMVSILNNYLFEKDGKMPKLHVVHRLDQPVEGVLVFAKTGKAAAELGRQAGDGRMKKIYRAVCCGPQHQEPSGTDDRKKVTLVDYLVKDGRENRSFVSDKNRKGAKRAELSYWIVERKHPYLLTEIELKTGRHHQIRVQMAHAGMPLYGDRKYQQNGQEQGRYPALCAVSLSFIHPVSGKNMTFEVKPEGEIFRIFHCW